MPRTLAITIVMLGLAGCASLPKWPFFVTGATAESRGEPAHYNFEWRLSGDRAVAPAQVFDNGRQTWLQFAPGQPLPAIFERTGRGDRHLDFRRDGPYVVLPGVWPNLILRGGRLKSFADRVADQSIKEPALSSSSGTPATVLAPEPMTTQAESSGVAPPVQVAAIAGAGAVDSATGLNAPVAPEPSNLPVASQNASDAPIGDVDFDSAPMAVPLGDQQAAYDPSESYAVDPADKNLRVALSRWARTAGWIFEAEHWAVDADIPIVGSARFELTFKGAVRELVASTELADRPLQPCFYSNKVLRVVPYAQSCNRTAGVPGSS